MSDLSNFDMVALYEDLKEWFTVAKPEYNGAGTGKIVWQKHGLAMGEWDAMGPKSKAEQDEITNILIAMRRLGLDPGWLVRDNVGGEPQNRFRAPAYLTYRDDGKYP